MAVKPEPQDPFPGIKSAADCYAENLGLNPGDEIPSAYDRLLELHGGTAGEGDNGEAH